MARPQVGPQDFDHKSDALCLRTSLHRRTEVSWL